MPEKIKALKLGQLHYPEAICSLFVAGLGQIIKGETPKGLKLLLTFYIFLPLLIYASLLLPGSLFLLVFTLAVLSGIIIWAYSLGEALINQ